LRFWPYRGKKAIIPEHAVHVLTLKQGVKNMSQDAGFFDKYRDYLILGALAAYLVLLVIGVVAEIFDIQSILDWWIWRPPGK
jgi:hypothetical protein